MIKSSVNEEKSSKCKRIHLLWSMGTFHSTYNSQPFHWASGWASRRIIIIAFPNALKEWANAPALKFANNLCHIYALYKWLKQTNRKKCTSFFKYQCIKHRSTSEGTVFTSPTWQPYCHFHMIIRATQILAVCRAKVVTDWTSSSDMVWSQESNPRTSHSAGQQSTN